MKQNEICWESGLNYVVSNPTCLPIQRIEIGILHKVSLYAQASQNKLWGKTRTLKFSSRNYLVQNKAPFGYSWKRRRILWTLYLKFKSFLINKQVKTKSAICTLFKICQSAWCLAWDISLLSRYFYLIFFYTQAPGFLGQPSGGPTTQAPAQQLRGPLTHGGFYGVEGHFKPELDRTLNNEHLFLIWIGKFFMPN